MRAWTHWLWLSCALGLAQCRKPPEPEAGSRNAPSPSAVAQLQATAAPSPASIASVEPAASSEPVAGPKSAAGLGQWLDASLYEFKAVAIRRCLAATLAPGAQPAPAAPNGGARVGVSVQIRAKVDSLLASPRDVTLENAGVILQAELNPGKACGAPLPTRQLRSGETAQGEVIFTLPDAEFAKALTLHFKPTRWGGAPGVSLPIPECLADCAASKPGQSPIRFANAAPRSKTR